MTEMHLSTPSDVEAALVSSALVPPGPPDNLSPGTTADLRAAMARFSAPGSHGPRRRDLVDVVGRIDAFPMAEAACARTGELLRAGAGELVADLGFVVPAEVLAQALGVEAAEAETVRLDVRAVAEVIGRQEPSSPASDAATDRLLERLGRDGAGVAALSLLYQAYDGTAALFAAAALARDTGAPRRSALGATSRVAVESTMIGGHEVEVGTTVDLNLETAGFEFGAGPHGCPGRSIAERLVAGMLQACDEADVRLDHAGVSRHPDGRPARLPRLGR